MKAKSYVITGILFVQILIVEKCISGRLDSIATPEQEIFSRRIDYCFNIEGIELLQQAIRPLLADINGDNYCDVVLLTYQFGDVITQEYYPVITFLNNHDGTFQQANVYKIKSNPLKIHDIICGLFNKDDFNDLIVIGDSLYIMINDGNGNFSIETEMLKRTADAGTMCDIDNDSDNDIALVFFTQDTTVQVLFNDGNGSFSKSNYYTTDLIPNKEYPTDICSVDLDQDYDSDIAILNWVNDASGSISIMLNDGEGHLLVKNKSYLTGGGEPHSFSVTDLDFDKFQDIVVANGYPGSISFFFGDSSLSYFNAVNFFDPHGYTDVVSFDFNKDGNIDVAAVSESLKIFLNQGNHLVKSFETQKFPVQKTKGEFPNIAGGDLDNDGDIDLVVTNLGDGTKSCTVNFSVFLNSLIAHVVSPDNTDKIDNFSLCQNYPNPFNSQTVIKYNLAEISNIKGGVFDLTGKEVITLVKEKQNKGQQQVVWNGRNEYGEKVSSGIYFFKLQTRTLNVCRKMIFIK